MSVDVGVSAMPATRKFDAFVPQWCRRSLMKSPFRGEKVSIWYTIVCAVILGASSRFFIDRNDLPILLDTKLDVFASFMARTSCHGPYYMHGTGPVKSIVYYIDIFFSYVTVNCNIILIIISFSFGWYFIQDPGRAPIESLRVFVSSLLRGNSSKQ